MLSPRFIRGQHSVLVGLTLCCIIVGSLLAQNSESTSQLPEAIRDAKIYQLPTKGGQPAPNPAVYKSVSIQDVNTERMVLALSVSIKPVDRAATVERMYFQDVRVNGIPVHIDTFDQEFKLSNKDTVDLPAPIPCTIEYADLESVQAVRELVGQEQIQITGQSYIEVKLNTLEKVALRAKQVVIPVSLKEQVPLHFLPGNPLLRAGMEAMLAALTNPTSAAAVSVAQQHLAKIHLDGSLKGKAKAAIYLLYTEFHIRDPKTQASELFSQSGTGFLISSDGKVLTTKRAIAPWKFDPQLDFLIEHQHLELDQSSVKIYAWPAGAQVLTAAGDPNIQAAASTEKQTLKVLEMPPDQMVPQDYQDPDSQERATLHLHAEGSGDLALLQLSGAGFQPLPIPDSSATIAAGSKLVLCSYPLGISQPQSALQLLDVHVSRQGDVLEMEHRADPGESGAPMLDADGRVVALATSANQGLPIQAARGLIR